jgi:hypothetical protein
MTIMIKQAGEMLDAPSVRDLGHGIGEIKRLYVRPAFRTNGQEVALVSQWIVASAGGAARHPAWYFNLARNPDKVWIKVDGRTLQVQVDSCHPAHAEALKPANKALPGRLHP